MNPEEFRSEQVTIRLFGDDVQWFKEHYPWRGSLPGFFTDCLRMLRKVVAERGIPTQTEITQQVIERITE